MRKIISKKSKSRDAGFKHPVIDGITFASGTEGNCYTLLKKAGFKPKYEECTFTLIEPMKPTVAFFTKDKKNSGLKLDMAKLRSTTYTPDFTFKYKNYFIVIEVKGHAWEDYLIKRKLFRHSLEKAKEFGDILFFEVYNIKMISQMIEIIKNL